MNHLCLKSGLSTNKFSKEGLETNLTIISNLYRKLQSLNMICNNVHCLTSMNLFLAEPLFAFGLKLVFSLLWWEIC